jgi:hypothetical protein
MNDEKDERRQQGRRHPRQDGVQCAEYAMNHGQSSEKITFWQLHLLLPKMIFVAFCLKSRF